MINKTIDGVDYTVSLSRASDITTVSIDADGVWAGFGTLSRTLRIEDCAADLGEDVYVALEAEIEDYFARGFGAEFDPS